MRIAVIAMGRLGGMETGYSSDADVIFVYEPADPAHPGPDDLGLAQQVIVRMRAMLSAPSTDPPLGVDADLRPEGRDGPLIRSLASYARYYARWSSPWEAQALLRARFVVGDAELGAPVHRADRPGALSRPRGSAPTSCSRSGGSRAGSTASGCPAAPTPRPTRSSDAAGWPTSSGPCSSCSCPTAPRAAPAHAADARGDPRGARCRVARPSRCGRPGRGLADGHAGPQRDHARPRQGGRPAADVRARPWSGSDGLWATRPGSIRAS